MNAKIKSNTGGILDFKILRYAREVMPPTHFNAKVHPSVQLSIMLSK
jgi:hypothetical protein